MQINADKHQIKMSSDKKFMDLNLKRDLLLHFLDICKACWFIHHKGYVHRDLKPENIFMKSHKERYPKIM